MKQAKKLSKAQRENINLHMIDNEVLGSIATVLLIVERDQKKGSNNRLLLKTSKEKLDYLQENYKLVKRRVIGKKELSNGKIVDLKE